MVKSVRVSRLLNHECPLQRGHLSKWLCLWIFQKEKTLLERLVLGFGLPSILFVVSGRKLPSKLVAYTKGIVCAITGLGEKDV